MMGTIQLEGETLGERHRHYNKLVKDATSTNRTHETKKIDYNEPDIDNLYKIDIASKERNVNYILEVLRCEDLLYISRALKKSVWLITDPQYADIVNPEYLHSQLLPQMISKAGHKLLLAIRLNLKDEKRVEPFYKYYNDKKDITTAMKWLPNCSVSFIEKEFEKHAADDISNKWIKRLCEKSTTILELRARKIRGYAITHLFSKTTFVINTDANRFIKILSSLIDYMPKLNPKSTKLIMKIRPDLVLDNFEKFTRIIDIPTFVKFLKPEDIQDFLMKHLKNNKLKSWFTFGIMKHFLLRIPSDFRFDFIKRVYIEKSQDIGNNDLVVKSRLSYRSRGSRNLQQTNNASIYRWYIFAPFSIAFIDLQKLIRLESNPSERNEMFKVLITCAKRNPENIHNVLQYYRDQHINEPFKFKNHFVNILLSRSDSHRFEDDTWIILNEIFCSMEVYSEFENNVQTILQHIIVHDVVHDTIVTNIVEEKFEFNTLKSFQSKLNEEEKEKVFNYLYQLITAEIQNITINSEDDLKIFQEDLLRALYLLNDWKKNILNYNFLLEMIKQLVEINDSNLLHLNLSRIYNVNKSWRKHMFRESLSLQLTQETCLNALKHGPDILISSNQIISLKDSIILTQFFNKLRIYWSRTLAMAFEDNSRNILNDDDDETKYKISTQALCVLLPRQQLTDILIKYKPTSTKITWKSTQNSTLSIQKCFARYMMLARPKPPVDIVLLYAKGDYLQFVLPSMISIFSNLNSEQSMKCIPGLLNAPVSLQKHILRIAYANLKVDNTLAIYQNVWKSTKNSSIRATVFKLVFQILCNEENEIKANEIWHVLETFIDKLTPNENRSIYMTLSKAQKVPLPVKPAYCMKSYRFLSSLPPIANCESLCKSLFDCTLDIMDFLDIDFVHEVIFESFDKKFTDLHGSYPNAIATYLLSTTSKAIQTQRYEKIFVPLLNKYFCCIKDNKSDHPYVKIHFWHILAMLHRRLEGITIKKNMVTPIKLFNDIYNNLEKNFSGEDNYVMIMTWNLAVKYVHLVEKYRLKEGDKPVKDKMEKDNANKNIMLSEIALEFGRVSLEQLKEEINKYFPSIYKLYATSLREIFDRLKFTNRMKLATLKAIQEHADIIEGYLLVIKLIPKYLHDTEDQQEKNYLCMKLCSHPSREVRMHCQWLLQKES